MKKFYIGPKKTTIENSNFFDGCITLFNDNATFDFWNPDTNALQISIYNKQLSELREPVELMAHNPRLLADCTLPKCTRQICKNPLVLLYILDNKNKTRLLMENIVPMIDYHIIKGKDINYKQLSNYISKDLVVQLPIGSGGSKTYFINQDNYHLFKFESNYDYSVSAYQHNNVSYNIHCIIGVEQIELLPPSIQTLEVSNIIEYVGNDFKTFIPNNVKTKLIEYSNNICKKVQSMGYLGVIGIDYIFANEELYFIEINPRFQGSTQQVDLLLKESHLPSIFAYNYFAFNNKDMPSTKNMKKSLFF